MKTKLSILAARLILIVCLLMSNILNAQSDYVVNGSASSTGDDCFIMTPDDFWQAGWVWYYNYIMLTSDFDMTFQLNLGTRQDDGADGIAFVMQPNSTGTGGAGVGIGYEGITPSIAVEYDTWYNDWNSEPIYDHINVHRNGDVSIYGAVAGPVTASATSDNIEDGLWHSTRITWSASTHTLTVYFDDVLRLTYTSDIVSNTFGGDPKVYWGLTGATGAARNLQQFCITSANFTELGINVSKTNVSCNAASDGTATFISINGNNPPYSFTGWYSGSDLLTTANTISNRAPGTYTAACTDGSNTIITKPVTITEPLALTFTYDVDNTCSGDITLTTSGGTPPYMYSDDGGLTYQASNVFANEPAGNYNLIVMDANNCSSNISTSTVTLSNPLMLSAITTPATDGCNGSVTLMPSGGSAPYTYASFSYPFSGSSLNTSLFNVSYFNFSEEGGGNLSVDIPIGCPEDYNTLATSTVFPRTAGESYEASFNFDSSPPRMYFGWTNGAALYGMEIAHGFYVPADQSLFIIESGESNWIDYGYINPGTWYDFKIELTSTGANYYYKESSSSEFNLVYTSNSGNNLYPEMVVGVGYYSSGYYYQSFNTKDWVVSGDPETTDLCPGTYNYTVCDAAGCYDNISVSITEGCASDLTVSAGDDATTYFGITSMQQVTRTAAASGGTPPYTFSWSLGRPLLCNQVNGSGDEAFYGGTCTDNTCPSNGSPTGTATCSGSATITAVLLDTTDICLTVTDANGCIATDCFAVNASDVRCFAGNSGANKVKMCHHTNSNGNPWVEICVDENAVDSHLTHGDYIGFCDFTKSTDPEVVEDMSLQFNLYPNPATNRVTVEFECITENPYTIELGDLTGRTLIAYQGKSVMGENTREIALTGINRGIYLVKLVLDGKQEVKKIAVE
jgi:hypothetical protein